MLLQVEKAGAAIPTTAAQVLKRRPTSYRKIASESRNVCLLQAGRVLLLLTQTSRSGQEAGDLWHLVECRLRRAYRGTL